MGPSPDPVIEVATLAGGEVNQDRYLIGTNFAAVLDGASAVRIRDDGKDGGWFAEQLSREIARTLRQDPQESLRRVLGCSLAALAERHSLTAANSPTSTLVLARWGCDVLDLLVIGDSTALVIREGDVMRLTDRRMEDIAPARREEYRQGLGSGGGFNERHARILAQLQVEQTRARNRPDGYWIAGASASAAEQCLELALPREEVEGLIIHTDGLDRLFHVGNDVAIRQALDRRDPRHALLQAKKYECEDPKGIQWPRAKQHDDKTLAFVDFRTSASGSGRTHERCIENDF